MASTGWITVKRNNNSVHAVRTRAISPEHRLTETFKLRCGSDFGSDSSDNIDSEETVNVDFDSTTVSDDDFTEETTEETTEDESIREVTLKIPQNISDITLEVPSSTTDVIIEVPSNIRANVVQPSTFFRRFQNKKWRGLDRGDDRQRLYQSLPGYYPGKIRRMYRRGRLVTSFPKDKLLRIAWKIGVSNPEGFGKEDCQFIGINGNGQGLEFFLTGWGDATKDIIGNYIWNRLYDTNEIMTS